MATRILEFGGANRFDTVPARSFVTKQAAMTATSSSAQSAAVNAATGMVCVQSDEQIYLELNANPTATTDSYRLNAGGEQYFSVDPNRSWKVAIRT